MPIASWPLPVKLALTWVAFQRLASSLANRQPRPAWRRPGPIRTRVDEGMVSRRAGVGRTTLLIFAEERQVAGPAPARMGEPRLGA